MNDKRFPPNEETDWLMLFQCVQCGLITTDKEGHDCKNPRGFPVVCSVCGEENWPTGGHRLDPFTGRIHCPKENNYA